VGKPIVGNQIAFPEIQGLQCNEAFEVGKPIVRNQLAVAEIQGKYIPARGVHTTSDVRSHCGQGRHV